MISICLFPRHYTPEIWPTTNFCFTTMNGISYTNPFTTNHDTLRISWFDHTPDDSCHRFPNDHYRPHFLDNNRFHYSTISKPFRDFDVDFING